MMANSPEAGPASAMTTEDLFGFLSGLASNPAVLSNAAGIISSAASGNTPALAGHVVGLLGAALPPATPAPDVETPPPLLRQRPQCTRLLQLPRPLSFRPRRRKYWAQ
ncbi:hypothetical protein GN244_ATG11580 [Phytophthora infestans]|uniref:Uncharacterized protein n=1 Tax=Phytophthora infestans TaxID=4787 RepID=A0A833SZW2_PHYIN|nr:hypothetical protein GN244_ATG11580 [Phytophthora infestans]